MVTFRDFCLPIIPDIPPIRFRSPLQSPIFFGVRPDPVASPERQLAMVLSQIITDEQVLAATTADVLAGTQLAQPGVPGVYTIWAASTVADSTITISMGGRTIANAAVIILRANSEIRENEDTNFQMLSPTGNRPVITITEVTAAAIRVRTKFLPAFAN